MQKWIENVGGLNCQWIKLSGRIQNTPAIVLDDITSQNM
jgi:hypothetical protein